MKRSHLKAVFVAATLVALVGSATAAVVTISPDNMQGWSITTANGAKAKITTGGAAAYGREKPFVSEEGKDFGKGAYYSEIGAEGKGTPPSAWLGLDSFDGQPLAGVALKRITGMEYYALNTLFPAGSGLGGKILKERPESWMQFTWWTYARQLIGLQLTAQSPDGKQRKQFWFLPWQDAVIRGENSGRHCNKWLRYDAIHANKPGPRMCGRWFTAGPPKQEFAAWADLVKAFGDWTLVPTSTQSFTEGGWKSAGWDDTTNPKGAPACTATGKCLNFVVGARSVRTDVFKDGSAANWAKDNASFKGYIDWFTLGIDGKNVTYNFEPAAGAKPPKIIAMSIKDALKVSPDSEDLVKVTGKVVERNNAKFVLDDGSGKQLCGFAQKTSHLRENPAKTGERWTVCGHIERVSFEPADDLPPMWTCRALMVKEK